MLILDCYVEIISDICLWAGLKTFAGRICPGVKALLE